MLLYFKYLKILLKAQMQYRISFWLLTVAQFLAPLSIFAGVYFLFARFGSIKGWNFFEVALCFSIIHMSFAISQCLGRGFDAFSGLVVSGEFDRLLVRPQSTLVQVMGSQIEISRIGRLFQSVAVFVWTVMNLTIHWNMAKVITLVLMTISGVFVFLGIFMLAATLCFWTIQGLEVVHILTDGGKELAQYPLDIYKKWVTRFFTYIIPFGCVNYLPLLFILDRAEGSGRLLYMLSPLFGIVFIVPCVFLWNYGVRHYLSTGS